MTAGPQAGMLLDDPYFPYTAAGPFCLPLLKQSILREGGLNSVPSSTHNDDQTTTSSSYHLQPQPPESYLHGEKTYSAAAQPRQPRLPGRSSFSKFLVSVQLPKPDFVGIRPMPLRLQSAHSRMQPQRFRQRHDVL